MPTRFAKNKDVTSAILGRLKPGTTQKSVAYLLKNDKDLKKLHLTSNPNKRVSYDRQKEIAKIVTDKIQEKGGRIKGFGKWGKQRGMISAVQKTAKDAREGSSSITASQNSKQNLGMLQKLRQKTGSMLSGDKNQPQISMQGEEAMLSGANLGQQNTDDKTPEPAPQETQEQDNKAVSADFQNQQKAPEDSAGQNEADLDQEPGFEMKK